MSFRSFVAQFVSQFAHLFPYTWLAIFTLVGQQDENKVSWQGAGSTQENLNILFINVCVEFLDKYKFIPLKVKKSIKPLGLKIILKN